jgi:predicted aspartyl protease
MLCRLFFCLLTAFFSGFLFAKETNHPITYRSDTRTFIPAYFELNTDKVLLDAPIGDVILQSPLIKLKMNGRGPFVFMFDTGFSTTTISQELAKTLNLHKVGKQKIKSTTPTQVVEVFQNIYVANTIEIGGVMIRDYAIVSNYNSGSEEQDFKKLKVDGVLSANAFYGLLFTLDYQNEKIHLERGDLLNKKGSLLSYAMVSDVPIIKAKIKFKNINKEVEQRFILDTGSGTYFFVNACQIPEMLNFKEKEKLISYDYLHHELKNYFVKLNGKISLSNEHEVNSPYITFGQTNCQLENPVGLIGRTFFEKNKVTIDQVNGLVKIEKY